MNLPAAKNSTYCCSSLRGISPAPCCSHLRHLKQHVNRTETCCKHGSSPVLYQSATLENSVSREKSAHLTVTQTGDMRPLILAHENHGKSAAATSSSQLTLPGLRDILEACFECSLITIVVCTMHTHLLSFSVLFSKHLFLQGRGVAARQSSTTM